MNIKTLTTMTFVLFLLNKSCSQIALVDKKTTKNLTTKTPVPMPEIIEADLTQDSLFSGIYYTNKEDTANLFFAWTDSVWNPYPMLMISVKNKELFAVPVDNIYQLQDVQKLVYLMSKTGHNSKSIVSNIYYAWESHDGEEEYDWLTELRIKLGL